MLDAHYTFNYSSNENLVYIYNSELFVPYSSNSNIPDPSDFLRDWWDINGGYGFDFNLELRISCWRTHNKNRVLCVIDENNQIIKLFDEYGKLVTDTYNYMQNIKTFLTFS